MKLRKEKLLGFILKIKSIRLNREARAANIGIANSGA